MAAGAVPHSPEGTVSILSRYILATYLKLMGLCLGSFVVIYLLIDFLEKINRFTRQHAAAGDIVMFFVYKVPEIVSQVIPLAVLMATLLALGALARNSEITAMQSCGISIARISRPLLLTAFAISLLTLFLTEFVVPVTYQRMRYVEDVLIGKKHDRTVFRENNIWYREQGYILQARVFDPSSTTLRGVTVWQRGTTILPVRRIDAAESVPTANGWELKQVSIRDFAGGGATTTTARPSLFLPLHLQEVDLKVVDQNAESMGILKLREYCRALREAGYDATRYVAQMHGRLSIAFASFVMAFIGIPFALKGSRSGGATVGVGVSLVIGFCYFLINSIVLSFGETGVVPPLVAAWSANVIFAMTAIWLTMTVNR